ncbi:hypothetical protein WR25_17475 [Diploscapter pachys]|uniref:Uncharacterized protein n=1 Tax=Diploscapter pachys TaxID=2018661 RepID=A0A2A2JWQ1_9BILA|nr:hypothetical protein WR25_17475 [Diploscapter pachys]
MGIGVCGGRLANDLSLERGIAPGLMGHPSQRHVQCTDGAAVELQRRGHGHQRKGIGGAIPDLQPVKIGKGHASLATPSADDHPGLKGGQGDAHIRWMNRHAQRAGAQNRMIAVETVTSRATAARCPFVARCRRVVEVEAAGALQQIAASAGHVAQLRGGTGQDRLGEQRIALFNERVPGQLGIADQRADAQPTVRSGGNITQRQVIDVDQLSGAGDILFHQIEQVGATGDKTCARPCELHSLVDAGGFGVGERRHGLQPPCPFISGNASSTAAVMLE